ncbi:MAG: DUF2779 domain-containing protein [Gammaproteobacteria bacterium]
MRRYRLSKSKVLSGMQCLKRLYLEVHQPELAETDEGREAVFATGRAVGEAARRQFPDGILIGHQDDLSLALKETAAHLSRKGPVTLFEATFQAEAVLVRCDVLRRNRVGKLTLIEIKSSTEPKPEHELDIAVQAWVLKRAGYQVDQIRLGYINRDFRYRGDGDYAGLFAYQDMRRAVREWFPRIPKLVENLKRTLAGKMPKIALGKQCFEPHECPFRNHCWPQAEYPVITLPRGKSLAFELLAEGLKDLREVPAERIKSEKQKWVHRVTCSGKAELRPDAGKVFKGLAYPRYYLDFETVSFAVPVWPNTRPYEALPFQFSCHVEREDGRVDHLEFLHDDGTPPMRAFAEAVVPAVGKRGPILVYSHYEKTILNSLARRFPDLESAIAKVIKRLVDLQPITEDNYYHADMQGSWSIKSVLPTIAPELDYEELGEIHDGGGASTAYLELIAEKTPAERHATLRQALLRYCQHDTLAMIEVARFLQHGRRQRVGT